MIFLKRVFLVLAICIFTYSHAQGLKETSLQIVHDTLTAGYYSSELPHEVLIEIGDTILNQIKGKASAYKVRQCYRALGNIFRLRGEYGKSLKYYKVSDSLSRHFNFEHREYIKIGHLYSQVGDNKVAKQYYKAAYQYGIDSLSGNSKNKIHFTAWARFHNGRMMLSDSTEKGIRFIRNAISLWKEAGKENRDSGALTHAYYTLANHFLNNTENIEYVNELADSCWYWGEIHELKPRSFSKIKAEIYYKQAEYDSAFYWAGKALRMKGMLEIYKSRLHTILFSVYEHKGEYQLALRHKILSDSIFDLLNNRSNRAAIAFNREQIQIEKVEQKNAQRILNEKNQKLKIAVVGIIFVILSIALFGRLRYVRKSKVIIERERDNSERLLLNILPGKIAQELKEKGKAEARDVEMVSILFTDFKGFTQASARLSAQDLVAELNICFEAFDGIISTYNIEKIKTIGDAYMAAGGLPVPTDDSVKNTVLAALEMQDFIGKRKKANDASGKPAFEMRVGIHTGPVVAGIVGVKKFQYDIWGDTVNTAARMESSGEVGKVNISLATYELLKSDADFAFESRGKIEAKGKGEMEMWFVRLKDKRG